MKRKPIISLIAAVLLLFVTSVQAEVKLPAIVSSNMVLQRNTTIQIWGWADAGEKVILEASWLNGPLSVNADNEGNWSVEVKTTKSKDPQTIKIAGKKSSITLENILFGEVWLCSGQSNMQMPLKGFDGQPVFGSALAIAKSTNPNLRLFSVDRVGSKTPLKDVGKYTAWQQASPDNVSDFSAVAYYFGQQLQEILDVPVGLIHTSWGGSSVQAWISTEEISNYQKINLKDVDISKNTNRIPTALFNSMIKPLIPYTIKGALWYQGESNRQHPKEYKELFPAMVKDWRTRWNIGDFPFYYVQIAPYQYNSGKDVFQNTDNSAFIRETQLQCLELIPNSGIAITMDIGEERNIHPAKKKEVADRLLLNALNQNYGYTAVDGTTPIYDSHEQEDGGLVLKFKNTKYGIYAYNGLTGFEIAGDDRVFYPAEAKIVDRKNVFVKNENVPDPVAVRYAWQDWIIGTLYNTSLLPASSFRTDNWENATQAKN